MRTPDLALLLVLTSLTTHARADDLTVAQMRRDDPRLEKRVTIAARQLFSGELVEELSRQTGVPITASSRDGSQDVQIAVFLRDIPVADAMEAFWSLVSYRGAQWMWVRDGDAAHASYRLVRTASAQRLAAAMRRQIQAEVEAIAEDLENAAEMKPDDRAKFLDKWVPRVLLGDKHLADLMKNEDRRWNGLRCFREALAPERRLQILRGSMPEALPVDSLSPEARAWIHKEWAGGYGYVTNPDGTTSPTPEPTSLNVYSRRFPFFLAPDVFMDMGWGSSGFLGGVPFEKALHKRILEMWSLSGDATTDDMEKRMVERDKSGRPPEEDSTLCVRLDQLASQAPVSLIAQLPVGYKSRWRDLGNPAGVTLGAFLDRENRDGQYRFLHKWRNHVLLLSRPVWVHEDEAYPPMGLVLRLRAAAARNSGYLPERDIFEAATLSPAQLAGMADEFPVMQEVSLRLGLLGAFARLPSLSGQVLSQEGASVAEIVSSIQSPPVGLQGDALRPGTRLRLTEKVNAFIGLLHVFELLSDGKWQRVDDFADAGIKPMR